MSPYDSHGESRKTRSSEDTLKLTELDESETNPHCHRTFLSLSTTEKKVLLQMYCQITLRWIIHVARNSK